MREIRFPLLVVVTVSVIAQIASANEVLPLLRELKGHATLVSQVVFSPDGQTLASGSGFFNGPAGEIWVWNPDSGERIVVLSLPGWWCESIAFSPDGQLFAVGGSVYFGRGGSYCGLTRVFDTESWRVVGSLSESGASRNSSLAFTPDGQYIVTCEDGRLKFWDLRTGQVSRSWAAQHALDTSYGFIKLAVSPDGSRVALGCNDGTVELWDAGTGQLLWALPGCPQGISSLAYRTDGSALAVGYLDGTITLWDAKSIGLRLWAITAHTTLVRAVAFSPKGCVVASGGGMTPRGELALWDALSGNILAFLNPPGGAVRALAFSPDGRMLATGSDDGVVRIWDVRAFISSP